MPKRQSLALQMVWALLTSALLSAAVFCLLHFAGGALLRERLEDPAVQQQTSDRRASELQDHIQQNSLALSDTEALTQWARRYPTLLVNIYRSHVLLYTSMAPDADFSSQDEEDAYYTWASYYVLTFADGDADVLLYSNDLYLYLARATLAEALLCVLLFLLLFVRYVRRLVSYIVLLSQEIQVLEGGDLDRPFTVRGRNELSSLAESLDSMRRAFKEQQEREATFTRAYQTMITSLSHDLRTPLTALLLYTEILRHKKYADSQQLDDYLQKIDAKAQQIRQLSDRIFEYALVSEAQEIQLEPPKPFHAIFHDLLSESAACLQQQGFTLLPVPDWPAGQISVYPPYIHRLIDNIVSNLLKYADPAVPIRVTAARDGAFLCLTFSNQVRPVSSQQGSSRIGLANVRTMMAKMGGSCQVETSAIDFTLALRFPLASTG